MEFEPKEPHVRRRAILTAGFLSLLGAAILSGPVLAQTIIEDRLPDGDAIETPRLFEDLDERNDEAETDWDDPADPSDSAFDLENPPGLDYDYEDGSD